MSSKIIRGKPRYTDCMYIKSRFVKQKHKKGS